MVFQQRNGCVDRYGQTKTPLIAHLFNEVNPSTNQGDLRILEILTEKDEQAVGAGVLRLSWPYALPRRWKPRRVGWAFDAPAGSRRHGLALMP